MELRDTMVNWISARRPDTPFEAVLGRNLRPQASVLPTCRTGDVIQSLGEVGLWARPSPLWPSVTADLQRGANETCPLSGEPNKLPHLAPADSSPF